MNMWLLLAGIVSTIFFLWWRAKHSDQDKVSFWSDIICQYPGEAIAYYNRANSFLQKKEIQLAIRDFDKAIYLSPCYFAAYVNRGKAHSLSKEYSLELADYNAAIKIRPNDIASYLNRASCYIDMKFYDKALRDYDHILSIYPQHQITLIRKKKLLERINQQKGQLLLLASQN